MKNELLLVLFIIGVALLSAGCVNEQMTADKIAEEMQKKQENVEDCSATIYSVLSYNGQFQEMKYEYIIKKPDKVKTVIILPEKEAGATTVSNGDITWIYDPSTDIVQVFDIPGMTSTTEADYADLIEHYMNQSEISFVGEEEFEGRNTYVVAVHKEEENEGKKIESDMNIWFDEETWLPLKIEITGHLGEDEDYTYVVEYQDFKVNTGISDEEFEFPIPDDAQVQMIDDYSDLFSMTPDQAQQEINFTILMPDYLPEGFELETIYTNIQYPDNDSGEEGVYLIYSNNGTTISICECTYNMSQKQDVPLYDEIQIVTINGIDGTLSTYADFKSLEWHSDELEITLKADLDDGEIIKIAESMNPVINNTRQQI